LARELASAFLRQAEEAGRVTEVGVARRDLALISHFQGDFVEARTHCEQALAACDPQHEEEARERYGEYTGTLVTACLALTSWQLGELERARELIETASRRATELRHFPSMAHPLLFKARLEMLRDDAPAALSAAEALEVLAQEHGMAFHRTMAKAISGWARGRIHDPVTGAEEIRQALAALAEIGENLDHIIYARLAELEAETLGVEKALERIDEALALTDQGRFCLSLLHRLRSKLLLKRDPPDLVLAEEALQTAIAIAKEQGARVSACKLRLPSPSSTNRPSGPPKLTPSSRVRLRAFRRRQKCRRSPRRKRCLRRWRRPKRSRPPLCSNNGVDNCRSPTGMR
jgi:tetratricopeptide (TPR) repeat protein